MRSREVEEERVESGEGAGDGVYLYSALQDHHRRIVTRVLSQHIPISDLDLPDSSFLFSRFLAFQKNFDPVYFPPLLFVDVHPFHFSNNCNAVGYS